MRAVLGSLVALLLVALATPAQGQQSVTITTYVPGPVEGPNEEKLDHEVPVAVNAEISPNFRDYASVESRLESLEDLSTAVSRRELGESRRGRTIWAIKLSDDDEVRDDGSPEPKVLISSLVHAREWLSYETVLRFVEHMQDNYQPDRGDVVEFLLRNVEIHVIPVLNPDGLVYTQHPDRYNKFVDFVEDIDNQWLVRDGRQHRKNLTDHEDEDFHPVEDRRPISYQSVTDAFEGLLGVDLNRNSQKGYGNGNADPDSYNSPDPRHENYRGTAGTDEATYNLDNGEPEIQVFTALLNELLAKGLRGFIDFHSFGKYIIQPLTGESARDEIARELRVRMRDAAASDYLIGPAFEVTGDKAGGALDEMVAFSQGSPPAYTVELPPDIASFGDDSRGFVPSAAAIPAAAAEGRAMAMVLADFAAGPAYLRRTVVWQDRPEGGAAADGRIDPLEIVYEAQWDPDPADATRRILSVRQTRSLEPGPARVLLVFSEPMKRDDGNGNPVEADGSQAQPPNQAKIRMPNGTELELSSVTGTGWLGTRIAGGEDGLEPGYYRYRFDTWEAGFTWNASAGPSGSPVLRVGATDLGGNALDAKPETVASWNAQWVSFENATGNVDGQGGVDESQTLALDTTPPSITITIDQPPTGFPGHND